MLGQSGLRRAWGSDYQTSCCPRPFPCLLESEDLGPQVSLLLLGALLFLSPDFFLFFFLFSFFYFFFQYKIGFIVSRIECVVVASVFVV